MSRLIAASLVAYAGVSFVAAEWNAFDWPLEFRFLFTWIVACTVLALLAWR